MNFLKKILLAPLSPQQRAFVDVMVENKQWLEDQGIPFRELFDALISHFKAAKSSGDITDELQDILQRPADIILAYRHREQKPNNLSSTQHVVLHRAFGKHDTAEAIEFLKRNFLLEALSPITFKAIAVELARHAPTLPQIVVVNPQEGIQGKQMRWA